jgi:hypothetical protein
MEFLDEIKLFIRDHNLPLTKELNACFLIVNLHHVGLMASAGNINKAEWDKLKANIVNNFPKCLINNKLPLSKKAATIVVWLGRKPYVVVSRLLEFVGYPKRAKN